MDALADERQHCNASFAIPCRTCKRKRVRVDCIGPCHCTEACPECNRPVFLPADTYRVALGLRSGHTQREPLTNEEIFALVRRQMGYKDP
jgi:hypothetical protein